MIFGFWWFINYIGQGKVTAKDLPDQHTIATKAATLSVEAKERIKKEIKLGWITMDNASNNNTMMAELQEYMVKQGMDFDRHGNRLQCFPHVVNLVVQDILGTLLESAVTYQDSLSQQGYVLENHPELKEYLSALSTLAKYAITHADYEALHDILTILNFAHRTQELLSSDRVPTLAFAIPLYHVLVDQWTQLQEMLPALSHALEVGIRKINVYLDKTHSSPVHIIAMALNPSIQYEWFDQIGPSEGEKARVIVKQHMLCCLEEQQNEHSKGVISLLILSQGATEMATRRLNTGYSNLLALGVGMWPASRQFPLLGKLGTMPSKPPHVTATPPKTSSCSYPNTSSVHIATSSTSQCPTPNCALNKATVELEHRKFEEDPVIAPKEMNGLTPVEYWL
ncbi:hypothetical protein FRC11_009773, partial [Ceratobasidium sp. 423]